MIPQSNVTNTIVSIKSKPHTNINLFNTNQVNCLVY